MSELTRRDFLKVGAITAAAVVVTGCAPQALNLPTPEPTSKSNQSQPDGVVNKPEATPTVISSYVEPRGYQTPEANKMDSWAATAIEEGDPAVLGIYSELFPNLTGARVVTQSNLSSLDTERQARIVNTTNNITTWLSREGKTDGQLVAIAIEGQESGLAKYEGLNTGLLYIYKDNTTGSSYMILGRGNEGEVAPVDWSDRIVAWRIKEFYPNAEDKTRSDVGLVISGNSYFPVLSTDSSTGSLDIKFVNPWEINQAVELECDPTDFANKVLAAPALPTTEVIQMPVHTVDQDFSAKNTQEFVGKFKGVSLPISLVTDDTLPLNSITVKDAGKPIIAESILQGMYEAWKKTRNEITFEDFVELCSKTQKGEVNPDSVDFTIRANTPTDEAYKPVEVKIRPFTEVGPDEKDVIQMKEFKIIFGLLNGHENRLKTGENTSMYGGNGLNMYPNGELVYFSVLTSSDREDVKGAYAGSATASISNIRTMLKSGVSQQSKDIMNKLGSYIKAD